MYLYFRSKTGHTSLIESFTNGARNQTGNRKILFTETDSYPTIWTTSSYTIRYSLSGAHLGAQFEGSGNLCG